MSGACWPGRRTEKNRFLCVDLRIRRVLARQRLSATEEITAPAVVTPSLLSATWLAALLDCQVVVVILMPRANRVDKKI